MKGNSSSKIIMGATVVMVGLVLALVLVLLAELYCSLFLRKRHHRHHPKRAYTSTSTAAAAAAAAPAPANDQQPPHPSDLCSFYAQGVVQAPRSFLFPAPYENLDMEKQLIHLPYPPSEEASPNSSATTMFICNPIYDDGGIRRVMSTPFQTPNTSPSRLEGDSPPSSHSPTSTCTPPLSPMKKLPPEGSSVSLRGARSICTSPTDSNGGISSSSSHSPSTSPSW